MVQKSGRDRAHMLSVACEPLEARRLFALTHLYTFNNGTPNDSVGSANGSLFNGAVINNGALWLQNYGLTSASATVQYAQLPDGILPASGSATIEVFYSSSSVSAQGQRVFDFGDKLGTSGNSFLAYTPQNSNSRPQAMIRSAGGTQRTSTPTTGGSAATGTPHVASIVVDSTAGNLLLYVDGVLKSTAALSGTTIGSVTEAAAYLGRSLTDTDPGMTGSIDEVRVYDTARTAAEVADSALAGPAQNAPAFAPRQVENLNRGVNGLYTGSAVYVSWRLLASDPTNVTFNLYRKIGSGTATKLNATPITQTTDYNDTGTTATNRQSAITYFVRTVISGIEGADSSTFVLPANPSTNPYLAVPISAPPGGTTPTGEEYTYSANDTSVGDLNGDGQYEFIVKWDPSNSKDNSQSGYTGNVFIDAYTLEGVRLWRIDLGRNIRAGAHYTQFQVYDYDGDGKAEMICKTAPGTVDSIGKNVLMGSDNPAADYRNSGGYILSGPEYLTIFNGLTGAAMDTLAYNPKRGITTNDPSSSQLNSIWGDSYGNRVDRFLASTAYLDGVHPSAVFSRGYYTRAVIAAYDWNGVDLTQRWVFDSNVNPGATIYRGQGSHSMSVGDVDGDGKDEIMFGAATINDDGNGLYSTQLGHGDATHLGDMDPRRPGLEIFMVHESESSYTKNGISYGGDYHDAGTGELLLNIATTGDVGRGVSFDVDPRYLGNEMWTSSNSNMLNVSGVVTSTARPGNYNFSVYWDADPLQELVASNTIDEWNYASNSTGRVLTAYQTGATTNNSTKSNSAVTADLFGDWREEIVWRNPDSTALLIYCTTTPAISRITTLMQDTQYRSAIAWQNTAYNQPPHVSFYLGDGMKQQPTPNVYMPVAAASPAMPGNVVATTTNPDKVTLTWVPNFDANGYVIQRAGPGGGAFTTIATLGPGATTFSESGIPANQQQSYRIKAVNAISESAWTTVSVILLNLPAPWTAQDVGSVGAPGLTTWQNGIFTVGGSGADIGGAGDAFRFVNQSISTDGSIVAQLLSQTKNGPASKAGVMWRASTAANSPYVDVVAIPGQGITMQWRNTNGITGYNEVAGTFFSPLIRISRTGSLFTGSYSTNGGTTWFNIGSSLTMPISAASVVGLAVTSNNNAAISYAQFMNVSVVPVIPKSNAAPMPTRPTIAASGTGRAGVGTTPGAATDATLVVASVPAEPSSALPPTGGTLLASTRPSAFSSLAVVVPKTLSRDVLLDDLRRRKDIFGSKL